MKIAFFHELSFGGARRVVNEYARILQKDHNLTLYYVDSERDNQAEEIFHSAHFYPFSYKQYKGNDWKLKFYKDTVELFKLYLLHRRIGIEINKEKFDFVFIHPSKFTQSPFILRFIKGPKVYFCQETLRMVYDPLVAMPELSFAKKIYERTIRLIRKFIDKHNIENADLILANSRFSKNAIKDAYQADAEVCYLGVDTTIFKDHQIAKVYDILFVGSKTGLKGYDILQKALFYFKNKPVVKIIDRKEKKSLSDLDLALEYNKACIVIVLGRNEPFGLVALESMACKIPVIALKEGGFQESIVNGKTGFLVEPNAGKVYQTIEKLLSSKILQKRLGQQGRNFVLSKWTWEKSVLRFLEIVEACIKKE